MTKYTPRMKRFAAEYSVDLNGARAARRAGYGKGAEVKGSLLQKHPRVKADIAARSQRLFERLELTPENVLEEIARIAFARLRRLYDDDGTPKSLEDIDDDTLAGVAAIDIIETRHGRVVRFRAMDRLGALVVLARHFGLLADRVEIDVDVGGDLAQAIERSRLQAIERAKLEYAE